MILLTGVSGFVGTHLVSALIEKYGQNNVVALTSKPLANCRYLLHHNYQFGADYFVKNDCESIKTIIHAGAYTPKKGSEASDVKLCNSNILNTEKLLCAHFPNLKKIIYLSTLDIYGSDEIISENTPEMPVSLYGFSKLYTEKMIECWALQQHVDCQILRVGHVYGPGEELYMKIIPVTIAKILQNEPAQINGTGEELRAFIYIKDLVNAIVNAIDLTEKLGVINLVSNQSISINDLVQLLLRLADSKKEVVRINETIQGRSLVFDNSKMKKYLLTSETALEEGLKEEFAYMKRKLER